MYSKEKRQEVIEAYKQCGDYEKTAKMPGISSVTVKKFVKAAQPEDREECRTSGAERYREQNTKKLRSLVDTYLDILGDREHIRESNLNHIAGTFSILMDKLNELDPHEIADNESAGVIIMPQVKDDKEEKLQ